MTRDLHSPSRRQLLGVGLSAAASLTSGVGLSMSCSQQHTTATFVLVHGAGHGGWCWQRVSDRLTAKGHRVFAPTLTGNGERSHLLHDGINLTTHITDVVNEIKWKDLDRIVLVGHSSGGMVITGVAEQLLARLRSIVYLDAFLPADGQSVSDIVNASVPGMMPPSLPPVIPPPPVSFFDVNDKDSAWVASKLTPQPTATLYEKLAVSGAFLKVPRKVFIGVTKGEKPFFQQVADRYVSDPSWQIHTVDCGHDVMIDKPDELAAILEQSI